jgi:hypothetical protein
MQIQSRVKVTNTESLYFDKIGIVEEVIKDKKGKLDKAKIIFEDTLTKHSIEIRDLKIVPFKYPLGQVLVINNPDSHWHNYSGCVVKHWFFKCQQYWLEIAGYEEKFLEKECFLTVPQTIAP